MKKFGVLVALALVAAGAVFAQTAPVPYGSQVYAATSAPSVKVDGRLALINGIIGIKSGNKTYYLPMLQRLSGFVDGIKEGASVKVEGYEYPLAAAPEYSTVMVTKLTIAGKDYDLSQYAGYGYGMRRGPRGGMWGGYGW